MRLRRTGGLLDRFISSPVTIQRFRIERAWEPTLEVLSAGLSHKASGRHQMWLGGGAGS